MKELTTYNRIAGYLNMIFDRLNEHFFEGVLSRPTITIQSTPRAYGHFTISDCTWISKNGGTHEINIGAGTLSRPIENVCATLVHEMVHYYCHIKGIKDTSRGYTYHNKHFKEEAEKRGLLIEHDDKYGWSITSPADELLQFCIDNDLSDILISRNEMPDFSFVGGKGGNTPTATPIAPTVAKKPSSTRKYICPKCKTSVRATKEVRIICADCVEIMVVEGC